MKLDEIAAKIGAHLKRMEADPEINRRIRNSHLALYWNARCVASGPKVFVSYVSFQGSSSLTKNEALKYLSWLDAGNNGTHWRMKNAREVSQ